MRPSARWLRPVPDRDTRPASARFALPSCSLAQPLPPLKAPYELPAKLGALLVKRLPHLPSSSWAPGALPNCTARMIRSNRVMAMQSSIQNAPSGIGALLLRPLRAFPVYSHRVLEPAPDQPLARKIPAGLPAVPIFHSLERCRPSQPHYLFYSLRSVVPAAVLLSLASPANSRVAVFQSAESARPSRSLRSGSSASRSPAPAGDWLAATKAIEKSNATQWTSHLPAPWPAPFLRRAIREE